MGDKRPYAKIDTGYILNPKWFRVERALRTDERIANRTDVRSLVRVARDAHLASILYCAQNVTDGVFPVDIIKSLVAVRPDEEVAITALFTAGLWDNETGGLATVHDYLEHQTSAAKVKQLSAAGKKAQAARAANKTANRGTNRNASRNAEEKRREEKRREHLKQSQTADTVVTEEQSTALAAEPEARADVESALDALDVAVVAAGYKKPSRTKGNRDAMRRLIDIDGQSLERIRAACQYLPSDEFWSPNIRSAKKLREKWHQLEGAARRRNRGGRPARSTTDDRVAGWLNLADQMPTAPSCSLGEVAA